ncbi:hypothetical protein C6366_14500 [Desulfonatronum sp. SC1]|nr:hypothetical protein C6366_14500 [Desulfonatronum sp. SC1]
MVAIASALIAGGCAYGQGVADTQIIYRLCHGDVHAVQMYVEPESVIITVKLTEGAAETFASLTEMNIGKNLIVLAGESKLSSAIVRSRIESGRVVSGPLTEPEARDLLGVLHEQLPLSPCGVVQHGPPVDAEPAARPRRN